MRDEHISITPLMTPILPAVQLGVPVVCHLEQSTSYKHLFAYCPQYTSFPSSVLQLALQTQHTSVPWRLVRSYTASIKRKNFWKKIQECS